MPGNNHNVQIIVAVIGVVGTITVALFANWGKIFPNEGVPGASTVTQQSTVQHSQQPQSKQSYLTITHIKIINDSDNVGAGEIYGFIKVNNKVIWQENTNNAHKIDTGNDLYINKTIYVNDSSGKFHITGYLKDDDAATTGKDDEIGKWDFEIATSSKGKGSKMSDPSGYGKSELFYALK